jgi:uncharacterized integral membrane protein (TIGR00697 family)
MNDELHRKRRDFLFLLLAGIFLTALVLGNVIGTSKFVTLFSFKLWPWLDAITPDLVKKSGVYAMNVPVGILAYPFTFLATDLISEPFGRTKAQQVVWVGFFMNVFMLFLMSVGHWLPDAAGVSGGLSLYEGVYGFMVANTIASMIAYLTAQSIDVQLFHFWKKLTHGKHLWLRNNGSTMVSQLIDSVAILTILFLTGSFGESIQTWSDLGVLIINSYLFKFLFALFDTPLFYLGVWAFRDFAEDEEVF